MYMIHIHKCKKCAKIDLKFVKLFWSFAFVDVWRRGNLYYTDIEMPNIGNNSAVSPGWTFKKVKFVKSRTYKYYNITYHVMYRRDNKFTKGKNAMNFESRNFSLCWSRRQCDGTEIVSFRVIKWQIQKTFDPRKEIHIFLRCDRNGNLL